MMVAINISRAPSNKEVSTITVLPLINELTILLIVDSYPFKV